MPDTPESRIDLRSDWNRRSEQWRRFADWEMDQLRARDSDLASVLEWMWDAWQTAKRHDENWSSATVPAEHVRELVALRRDLARAVIAP